MSRRSRGWRSLGWRTVAPERRHGPLSLARGWHIVHALAVQSGFHGTGLLAAALAFFGLFSLFPLLLLAVSLSGYFVPPSQLEADVTRLVGAYAPSAESLVAANLERLMQLRSSLGIVGAVGLFWAGSNVFAVLSVTLNRIWDVRTPRQFWWRRLLGLLEVVVAGSILAGTFALTAVARAIVSFAGRYSSSAEFFGSELLAVLSALAFPVATLAIVGLGYRFLPTVRPRPGWSAVWLAALLVTATMQVSRYAFGWYVSTLGTYELIYGGLTAFVVLALWAYVLAWLYLHGAELAAILDRLGRERE